MEGGRGRDQWRDIEGREGGGRVGEGSMKGEREREGEGSIEREGGKNVN